MSTQHNEFPELTPKAQAACNVACVAWQQQQPSIYPADRRALRAFLLEAMKQADESGFAWLELEAIADNLHNPPPPPPPPPTLAEAREADLDTAVGRDVVRDSLASLGGGEGGVRVSEFASSADQARELGLKAGDTLQGRQKVGEGWHEARITLLWIGKVNTVWIVSGRGHGRPWSPPYEATGWELHCRKWERIETPPEHAALLPAPASTAGRAADLLEQSTPSPLPPGYIDREHQGEDRKLLEAFYLGWQPGGGTTDEKVLRSIRAVLALRPSVADVRAADAAISDEALEAEFRAWWKAKVNPLKAPPYHAYTTHIFWARHLLSRGKS